MAATIQSPFSAFSPKTGGDSFLSGTGRRRANANQPYPNTASTGHLSSKCGAMPSRRPMAWLRRGVGAPDRKCRRPHGKGREGPRRAAEAFLARFGCRLIRATVPGLCRLPFGAKKCGAFFPHQAGSADVPADACRHRLGGDRTPIAGRRAFAAAKEDETLFLSTFQQFRPACRLHLQK